MADDIKVKMSEFAQATQINNADDIIILQNGENKKVKSPILESKIITRTVEELSKDGGVALNLVNLKGVVATYANLPTTNLQINDAYQVEADGLVYVYTENGFQADGDGFKVQAEPTGVVEDGNTQAVSGGEVNIFETNKKNLFTDSYFKDAVDKDTKFGNIDLISSSFNYIVKDYDAKYRKSFSYTGSENATLRLRFKLSDLGLNVGEHFSLSTLISNTDTSRGRFHYFLLNSSATRITSVVYSNLSIAPTDYKKCFIENQLIIENTAYIEIWLEKYSGDGEINFTGLSINKGSKSYNYEIPNSFEKDEFIKYDVSNRIQNKYPNIIDKVTTRETTTSLQRDKAKLVEITENHKLKEYGYNYRLLKENTETTASLIINNANKWNKNVPMSVILPFYVEDVSTLTNVVLDIRNNNGANVWSRGFTDSHFGSKSIKKGWNLLRWNTLDSTITNFGIDISSFRVVLYCNSNIDFYTPGVFFEYAEKAKMLFVNDHARSGGWLHLVDGQTQNGIKDCEDLGMKVTFALNPKKHEQGDSLRFTMGELETLKESNISYFSFHSYNADVTSSMTAIDLQNDAKLCINWLQSKGFGKPNFRACFTQNLATNGISNFNFMGLNTLATHKGNTGRHVGFPLFGRNNVPRYAIHGLTNSQIDTIFTNLQLVKGVTIPYTHAILSDDDVSSDSAYSVKLSTWKYFLSKCLEAKNAGWLEFVSYEDLVKELEDNDLLDNDESIINRMFNIFY